jgi:hypothetical protein
MSESPASHTFSGACGVGTRRRGTVVVVGARVVVTTGWGATVLRSPGGNEVGAGGPLCPEVDGTGGTATSGGTLTGVCPELRSSFSQWCGRSRRVH